MKRRGDKTHHCGVPHPHGTALTACHLIEHKPLVGSRMTEWHVTTDHQRPTPAKLSNVYPEELGHMLFQDRQCMQRDLCHTPEISQRFASE